METPHKVEGLPHEVEGWAAPDESGVLVPFKFTRRATGPDDVTFKVLYCGICHTDLHELRNQWKNSHYPILPGHEIVGIVTEVGTNVSDFKVGERVGVGLLVWSCAECDACHKGQEQYCDKSVWSFNGTYIDGTPTYGGYSNLMVTDKRFVLHMPDNLPLDAAAPLLCAGITIYSPMKYFGMTEKGKNFGVVGLGGLGHMAVKFGKAFGLVVTIISTHPSKEEEALHTLGADHFLNSRDPEQMEKAAKSMDYIIDTVSAFHSLDSLLQLLKVNGRLILVGLPEKPLQLISSNVVCGRRFVGGSLVGGLQETQEMLDFCGEHNISATIEKLPLKCVNKAMERLEEGDVKYRFVLDIGGGDTPM
eukprot:c26495_g1_i1 orf=225-1310(-)